MFKTTARLLSLTVLLSAFVFAAFAQDAKPLYVQVNYIKVDRNKSDQYRDLLNNYGRKIWKSRIAKGELISVSTYTINMKSEDHDYNYATVIMSNSLNALLEPSESPEEVLKKAMPGTNDAMIRETLAKYGDVRVIQKTVILRWVDGIRPNEGVDPKIFQLDYMKTMPGKDAEYVKLEREVFKPLHQERIKAGQAAAWDLWEVVMPWADDSGFGYITTTGITDWDKLMSTDYGAIYKKVFPKGDATKLGAQVGAARKISNSEIWRQVFSEEGK